MKAINSTPHVPHGWAVLIDALAELGRGEIERRKRDHAAQQFDQPNGMAASADDAGMLPADQPTTYAPESR